MKAHDGGCRGVRGVLICGLEERGGVKIISFREIRLERGGWWERGRMGTGGFQMKTMDGWMDGWMGGWRGEGAGSGMWG